MSITVAESEQLDTLGGWHPDPALRKFPCGSCFEVEGRYLYRTVRNTRPRIVVEVGRWEGCSTSHIALALKHNGYGKLYSLDINESMGSMIPDDLHHWIEFVNVDALIYEWPKNLPIDLLLEDGLHSSGFTANILRRYKAKKVIVHDYFHPTTPEPRKDCLEVFGEPHSTFFEPPSDCGYACYSFEK